MSVSDARIADVAEWAIFDAKVFDETTDEFHQAVDTLTEHIQDCIRSEIELLRSRPARIINGQIDLR